MSSVTLRSAAASDAPALAAIYNHYIVETVATFEEQPVGPDEMARRLEQVLAAGLPWLAAVRTEAVSSAEPVGSTKAARAAEVVGYAYAAPWKLRAAYRLSAEVTIYLAPDHQHGGIGSRLYSALFDALRGLGMHAVIGGIALPNDASVALHEKFGMCKVAHVPEIGFKHGRFVDVGYWHCILSTPP